MADDRFLYITCGTVFPELCPVTNKELKDGDGSLEPKSRLHSALGLSAPSRPHAGDADCHPNRSEKIPAIYWLREAERKKFARSRRTAAGLIVASVAAFVGCMFVRDEGLAGGIMPI